jgi:hypothetical protein
MEKIVCDECGNDTFESLPLWLIVKGRKEGYLKCKKCPNYVRANLIKEDRE